jgi:hypothetical protein
MPPENKMVREVYRVQNTQYTACRSQQLQQKNRYVSSHPSPDTPGGTGTSREETMHRYTTCTQQHTEGRTGRDGETECVPTGQQGILAGSSRSGIGMKA